MAEIKGTNITAPIAPFTTDDIYPTHYAEYGKGGYRTLESKSDLDSIPEARLEIGMIVYVKEDSKMYQLQSDNTDNTWKELSTGGSELKYYSEDGNYQSIFPYYAGEIVESENTVSSISIAKENEGFNINDNSITMMSVDGELKGSTFYLDKSKIRMSADQVDVEGQEFRTNVEYLTLNANHSTISSDDFNILGKAYYRGRELAAYDAGENITIDEDGKINAFKDIITINKVGDSKALIFQGNNLKYPNSVNVGTYSPLGSSILGVANSLGDGSANVQNCLLQGAYQVHNNGNYCQMFGNHNDVLTGSLAFVAGGYNHIDNAFNNASVTMGHSNYANKGGQMLLIGFGNTEIQNTDIHNNALIGSFLKDYSVGTGSNINNFLYGNYMENIQSAGVLMLGAQQTTALPYINVTGSANATTLTINSKSLGNYKLEDLVGLTPNSINLTNQRALQKTVITAITDTTVTFDVAPFTSAVSNLKLYLPHSVSNHNCNRSALIGRNNYLYNASDSFELGFGHRIENKSNVFALGKWSDTTKDGSFFIGDGTSATDRHNFIYGLKNDYTIDSTKLTLEVDEFNVKGVNGNVVDKLNKIEELELFKYPNVTIYGNPTIKQGQVSDFSATNYLRFPYLINFDGKPFKIMFAFTTGEYDTAQQNIIDSNKGLAIAIRGRQLVYNVSFNGTSWVFETICSATIQPNTTYYAQFVYDGTSYHMDLTEDPIEGYTRVGSFRAPNTSLYPTPIYIGKSIDSSNYFKGIINLNEASLMVGDQGVIWTGMDDSGMASRLSVDLTNISDAGEAKIKEIAGGGGTALNYYSEDTTTETANINANGGLIVNGKKMPTFEYDDETETLNITF